MSNSRALNFTVDEMNVGEVYLSNLNLVTDRLEEFTDIKSRHIEIISLMNSAHDIINGSTSFQRPLAVFAASGSFTERLPKAQAIAELTAEPKSALGPKDEFLARTITSWADLKGFSLIKSPETRMELIRFVAVKAAEVVNGKTEAEDFFNNVALIFDNQKYHNNGLEGALHEVKAAWPELSEDSRVSNLADFYVSNYTNRLSLDQRVSARAS